MPSPPPVTQHHRTLSKSDLPKALLSSKTTLFTDAAPSTRPSSYQPPSTIRTLAWSPAGTLLASADVRTLRVWNADKPAARYSTELRSGTSARGAAGAPMAVERVGWRPGSEAELASTGGDGAVRFWDVRSRGALVGEVKIGGEGFSMAWRPDSGEVLVGRKDDVLVRVSRREMKVLDSVKQSVQTNQIAFCASGSELLLPTGDGKVRIVEFPSMKYLHDLNAHTSAATIATQSPSARYIATGGSDALVTLWDTTDWTCRHSLTELGGPVRSLSFSFDGAYICAGTDEGGAGLGVAHVESGEVVHVISSTGPTPCVAWHPNRYWLAYSGDPAGMKVVGTGNNGML